VARRPPERLAGCSYRCRAVPDSDELPGRRRRRGRGRPAVRPCRDDGRTGEPGRARGPARPRAVKNC